MTRKTNEQHTSDVVYPQTDVKSWKTEKKERQKSHNKDEQKYRKRNNRRADRETSKHNDIESKIRINKRC